jgi:aryl-alcohol dehydrogenase
MVNTSGRRGDGSVAGTDSSGDRVNNRWFAQSSFGHHAIATERNAVVVDRGLPFEILAPLGCGLQTGAGTVLNELDLQPGQTIAITGVGAVGLAAVMAAKIAGASEIVVADMHQSRLDLAVELGATRTVLSPVPDLAAALRGGADGLDYVIDTTAVEGVVKAGLGALHRGGRSVMLGSAMTPFSLTTADLTGVKLGFVLEGSSLPQTFVPRLIEYWRSGQFPVERLIASYPLTSINDAERDMVSGSVIKPVLIPSH